MAGASAPGSFCQPAFLRISVPRLEGQWINCAKFLTPTTGVMAQLPSACGEVNNRLGCLTGGAVTPSGLNIQGILTSLQAAVQNYVCTLLRYRHRVIEDAGK